MDSAVAPMRPFELDHLRAIQRKQSRAIGTGNHLREIEYSHPMQCHRATAASVVFRRCHAATYPLRRPSNGIAALMDFE